MSKRLQAKHKLDRRMGENIWGRPKSPVNRREYGPGQHGQRRKGKLSDFGVQLRAKQKLKGYYANISEKQFRKIYAEAVRLRGDTGAILIGLLERRLDALIYRAKLVPTVFSARQFVSHGHVKVNGKRVTIPSFRVRVGETVVPGIQNSAASTIMTIADMSLITAEVKVDEADIVSVVLDQQAMSLDTVIVRPPRFIASRPGKVKARE